MNISNHFYERYAQRVLKVEESKIKKYIMENKQSLMDQIIEMYSKSKFLYYGKIASEELRNFYVNEESHFVLVVNKINDCLITIFEIDFGFPEEINKNVTKGLLDEIAKYREELEEKKQDQQERIATRHVDINNIDLEIQEYENKIKFLTSQKNLLNQEIICIKNESKPIEDKIKKHSYQLCNSMDYKAECLRTAK